MFISLNVFVFNGANIKSFFYRSKNFKHIAVIKSALCIKIWTMPFETTMSYVLKKRRPLQSSFPNWLTPNQFCTLFNQTNYLNY